jgi:hypothetical protein
MEILKSIQWPTVAAAVVITIVVLMLVGRKG